MFLSITIFILIFASGELIANNTIFPYLKSYFALEESKQNAKPFLGMNISTFKGVLERFVLFLALVLDISQILIVFGALKIGSRFDKNQKILNDYFIIGNFGSILLVIFYLILNKMIILQIAFHF